MRTDHGPALARVHAARMALLTTKPLNLNAGYVQNTAYLVLLKGPAGARRPEPSAEEE